MVTAGSPHRSRAGPGRWRWERRKALGLWATLGLVLVLGPEPRLSAQEPPRARQRWHADDGENLRIAGNARAAALERVAAAARETRAAVLALLATPDHSSPLPTRIVLFKEHSEFSRYARDAAGVEPVAPLVTARGRLRRTIVLSIEAIACSLAGLIQPHPRTRRQSLVLRNQLLDFCRSLGKCNLQLEPESAAKILGPKPTWRRQSSLLRPKALRKGQ